MTARDAASAPRGGYWRLTIEALDRIIDLAERQRQLLQQSKHLHPASEMEKARDIVTAVRNDLVGKQYDIDRKAIPDE